MKEIDKTKKSNIKCEHCEHYCDDMCILISKPKHYWNRCKSFEWHSKYSQQV